MNATCPECNTELDEDFGIVTCASCGAVCSIDLDGSVSVQSNSLEGEAEVEVDDYELEENMADSVEEDLDSLELEGQAGDVESFEALAEEGLNSEVGAIDEGSDLNTSDLESPNSENSNFENPEDSEKYLDESSEVDSPSSANTPLSSQSFFQGLDIFSDQLEAKDHHHTFFDLMVSGFETKKDLKETLELSLDDRLEVTADKVLFDKERQEFRIAKVNYLRLVNLHKRLSSLSFIKLDWLLSESPKALKLSKNFTSPLTAEESLTENLDFTDSIDEDVEATEAPSEETESTQSTGFVEEEKDSSMVYDSDLTATSEIESEDLPPPFEDDDLNDLDTEDDFS